MKKLDESEIIRIFQRGLDINNSEDIEVFDFGKIRMVAKSDTLVESTDIPQGMKLSDAARKSVLACVSDFASKGVRPEYGMISVNLPGTVSRPKVREIVSGFKRACAEFGISILGGDTNQGREIVFNVCLFGTTESIVSRSGSKQGDLIFVTGPFGYTSAGLDMLLGGMRGRKRFAEKSVNSVIRPKSRLDFGVKNKRYFTSSMDSSDGLSTTLNEMSRQSKKKFVINNIPALKDVRDFARDYKLDLNNLVFNGGEEYEFVFTIPPKYKKNIKRYATLSKTPILEIGHVTLGTGVYVEKDGGLIRLKDMGWRHFR